MSLPRDIDLIIFRYNPMGQWQKLLENYGPKILSYESSQILREMKISPQELEDHRIGDIPKEKLVLGSFLYLLIHLSDVNTELLNTVLNDNLIGELEFIEDSHITFDQKESGINPELSHFLQQLPILIDFFGIELNLRYAYYYMKRDDWKEAQKIIISPQNEEEIGQLFSDDSLSLLIDPLTKALVEDISIDQLRPGVIRASENIPFLQLDPLKHTSYQCFKGSNCKNGIFSEAREVIDILNYLAKMFKDVDETKETLVIKDLFYALYPKSSEPPFNGPKELLVEIFHYNPFSVWKEIREAYGDKFLAKLALKDLMDILQPIKMPTEYKTEESKTSYQELFEESEKKREILLSSSNPAEISVVLEGYLPDIVFLFVLSRIPNWNLISESLKGVSIGYDNYSDNRSYYQGIGYLENIKFPKFYLKPFVRAGNWDGAIDLIDEIGKDGYLPLGRSFYYAITTAYLRNKNSPGLRIFMKLLLKKYESYLVQLPTDIKFIANYIVPEDVRKFKGLPR